MVKFLEARGGIEPPNKGFAFALRVISDVGARSGEAECGARYPKIRGR
jgi:hypothetical protein